MILFARRLVLTVSIATGVVWLGAGIASADARSELEAAQRDYALARDAEKLASEALDRAEDTLKAAVARVTAVADAQLAALGALQQRRTAAERAVMALLERRAEVELEVARARDEAGEARRAYDQARPIYLLIGRTQQLSDYPEWKAIERRASETSRALAGIVAATQPRLAAIDQEIEVAKLRVLAIDREFGRPVAGPDDAAMRGWIEAARAVGLARGKHAEARRILTAAFDIYLSKLAPARPAYLESVEVEIGILTAYSGVWRRKKESSDEDAARIADLRSVRDDLAATINERDHQAEEWREERLAIAESMHATTLRYVAAEERRVDAQLKKIGFAALAEIGGTIVEVALTGGAATVLRKASEVTEQKVAEMAAQKLLRQAAPLTDEATEAAARLARRSEAAFARQVRSAYAEAERLAVEAAARRVQRTGEALDAATIDARRQLQRALKGLVDSDPALRAEAQRLARRLLGEQAVIVLDPIVQAAAGKTGGGAIADLLHGGGAGSDPVQRLAADSPAAAANDAVADVKSVVMGDLYEQGIARGISYAVEVAPDAARAGLKAARDAAAANASRWRQVASGSKEFLKGGVKWSNFKEAMKGSARGNLVGLATTSAKALVVAYYGSEEQAAAELAFTLYARLTVEQKQLNRLREAGNALAMELNEARRLRAELDTYLALLGSPRELEIRDDLDAGRSRADVVVLLRLSTPVDRAPKATLAGVALDLAPQGGEGGQAALWKATVRRDALPADDRALQLEVALAPETKPFALLDSNPATPARPDPRAQPAAVSTDIKWIGLDPGSDRHHRIVLGDPWTGIWTRGATRIRITRDRDYLTGVIESLAEASKTERGFAVGDEVLRGDIRSDRTASLQMLARYDRQWTGKCPARAEGYWSRGRYSLDPAGVLTGDWEDRQLGADCVVAETVNRTDTLRRENGK